MFLHDFPSAVVACPERDLFGGNFDQAIAVGVGHPMSRRKDLEVVDWLGAVVVGVVVDFAVELVGDDFVFMGFDGFMGHGWEIISDC